MCRNRQTTNKELNKTKTKTLLPLLFVNIPIIHLWSGQIAMAPEVKCKSPCSGLCSIQEESQKSGRKSIWRRCAAPIYISTKKSACYRSAGFPQRSLRVRQDTSWRCRPRHKYWESDRAGHPIDVQKHNCPYFPTMIWETGGCFSWGILLQQSKIFGFTICPISHLLLSMYWNSRPIRMPKKSITPGPLGNCLCTCARAARPFPSKGALRKWRASNSSPMRLSSWATDSTGCISSTEAAANATATVGRALWADNWKEHGS